MANKDKEYENIVNVLENIGYKDFALYVLLKDYREKLAKEIKLMEASANYDIKNMCKNEYIIYNEMLKTYNAVYNLIELLAYDLF